jgi:hypothetical protein
METLMNLLQVSWLIFLSYWGHGFTFFQQRS